MKLTRSRTTTILRGTSGILNCALLRGYEAGQLDSNGWYLVVVSQYEAVNDGY